MKNKLLLIFTNPLFLSLVLTIILLLILPPFFPKYNIDLNKKEKRAPNDYTHYCDLNSDGFSEQISIMQGYENRTSILVREKGVTVDQWSFRGNLTMQNLFFGDFNNDGLKEVFLFTIFENKILLNCFNPFENAKYIEDKHVDYFYPKNGEKTCSPDYFKLIDLSDDFTNEFVFSINTGFSIFPRRMYSYNFVKDTLYKSLQSCSNFRNVMFVNEFPDEPPLFYVSTDAVGNCDSVAIFSDQFSWLKVFDKNLKFKFEPIKVGYYPPSLSVLPININNKVFLVALNIYFGKENHPCSIALYDLDGKKIKEKNFPYVSEWYSARLINKGNDYNKIFVFKENGSIEEIDENLNFIKEKEVMEIQQNKPINIDLDLDHEDELVFHNRDQEKLTILRNDFSDPMVVDVSGNNSLHYCDVILKGNEKPQLFLRFDNYSYYDEYYHNPLYKFQYLIYGLIYLGVFVVLFLLQKVEQYRVEHKYKAEKKISELQIKSIKNQTDPHFTLNVINSIGSLFAKQDTEKANYIFGKYSKLLRSTILSSDQILTTIDDEVEYVENYLSLEQFRFKEGFDFKIEKEESINGKVKIPKMLIHTFVENAIKHGIKHLEERGKLEVSISNGNAEYEIKIIDNGIGREKAKEINTFGTGKGLEIMNQILDLYYTLEKIRITYKIKDLTNQQNESLGTEVLIKIPIFNV